MEITKNNKKIICEIMGCKNPASYVLKNEKALFNNNLFVCEKCINEMHNLFSKVIVPKGIKNIYKKGDSNEKR